MIIAPSGQKLAAALKTDHSGDILNHTLDFESGGVDKHIGLIAESMNEWEGRIAEGLGLTNADVNHIKLLQKQSLKLQS